MNRVPWLTDDAPASYEDLLWGYVVVHCRQPLRYWTGSLGPERRWSHNPRRALVDAVAPWGILGDLQRLARGGRCVRVLLEDEVTMLPLRHWPQA